MFKLLAFFTALVLSGAPLGAAEPAPIKLAAILAISGRYAILGEPMKNAIMIAQKHVNASGGIKGHPLEIEFLDDEGQADTAAQLATGAIGRGVAGIIGSNSTAASVAIARAATQAKVPLIYMTPTADVWNTKAGVAHYVFQTTPRDAVELPALLAFITSKLGDRKIGILHDENPYGAGGAKIITDIADANHVDIVANESYPGTATDFTPQLIHIKNSGAQTIVLLGSNTAPPLAVRQIHQLGLNVHIVGSLGIVSDQFLTVAGKDGENVYSDTNLNFTHPNAVQKTFLQKYHDAYRARPSNFAAFANDAVELFAYAFRQTGGATNGDAFAAALEQMKPLTLVTATYQMTPSDHNGVKAPDVHVAVDRNQIWFNL